ncbi:hypothetical protein [Nocardiopsis suaedae]|uniref:DUF600 family protein n=1 Tax=Nocardiopsis suaedae TaxID=3018444 RepID=A0ABT4TMH7_9ACTN|nr:hypothetical protein [Nocardiopsis suaedae]MDA2805898.1 hypothetical protein [Nocardiopsis suaedae]
MPAVVYRGQFGIGEEKELVEEAVRVLARGLPEGWSEVKFRADALHGYMETYGIVTMEDGGQKEFNGNFVILKVLHDLRVGMYMQDKGTWYSMRILLDGNGKYSVNYNYNYAPRFNVPPTNQTYLEDLKYFPREEEQIPGWLKEMRTERSS